MEVDAEPVPSFQQSALSETAHQNPVQMESNGLDAEKPQTRSNAIHFTGVDDLNTEDMEKLLVTYYNKPFQVEWIDDSSLNIVYDDPEDAFQCLVAVTAPEEFEAPEPIAPEQLRKTKSHPSHPEAELKARFALSTDKKSNGSRAKSRYYLLHGEPSRKEDLVRFGSKRSKPMKYGFKGREILSKSKRGDRVGDLFPEKTPTVSLEEMDVEMDDLLPNKKPKRGSRGGRRRNRGNKGQPDLFADKLNGPKKASDDRNESKGSTDNGPAKSIYQNMDY